MNIASAKAHLRGVPRQAGDHHIHVEPRGSIGASPGAYLQRLAAGIAILGIVLPIATTCWHLSDYYGLEHGAAVWIALSDWASHGTLMPPLSFDGHYAGTRYMPLPIMTQSLVADMVDSQVAGGRLVSLAGVLALVSTLLFAFRRVGLAWTPCLLLISSMLIPPALNFSVVSIRHDALPAALQVLAIVILADRRYARRPRAWLLAGLLAGLAMNWKASAAWCIAAVVLYAISQPRRFVELRQQYACFFVGAFGMLAAGAVAAVAMTDGRIVSNFRELLFSSEYSAMNLQAWIRPYSSLFIFGMGILSIPVCFGLMYLAIRRGASGILRASVVSCAALTSLIFVDYQGASVNHFVDLLALGSLGIAWAIHSTWNSFSERQAIIATGSAAAIIFANIVGVWLGPFLAAARDSTVPAYSLGQTKVEPGQILSENPLVNIALGQQPVIADPFAFRRIAAKNPEFKDDVIRRIQRREFPAVVLLARAGRESSVWYKDGSWGDDVLDAICDSYHPEALIAEGKFEIFLPGRVLSESSAPCNRQPVRAD